MAYGYSELNLLFGPNKCFSTKPLLEVLVAESLQW